MPLTEKEAEKGKAERRSLEVRLEDRNLELKYPKQVLVPGAPK